jgi:Mg-chelatase subunit ChlD
MTNNHNDPQGAGTTLLVLVVDRSGSMETICSDMEGGIKHLIQEQATGPGDCVVTLAQFDTEYELVFEALPAAEVTGYHLVPRGSTALLDAIGRTIGQVRSWLDSMPAQHRPDQVVFAVVTDGLENSSREWTRDQVTAAVKDRSNAGWQFSFLGANQDAIKEGGDLGVDATRAMTYSPAPHAVAAAMSSLSESVKRVKTGKDRLLSFTDEERRSSRG